MPSKEQDFWTIEEEPWTGILDHSVGDYPQEACGILLCPCEKPGNITSAYPTRNATSGDSATRYLLDPLEFLQVQKWAEQRELDICGFYHSHPDFSAVPSDHDREFAWEGYLYLIIAIKNGIFEESRAWKWDAVEERFEEVYSSTTI
ncbi:MAG: M67 family metallopeptidase [Desulfobacterales bacterium]|nr:M67 family metallopeptidase [Desulfobacterales bacterium]